MCWLAVPGEPLWSDGSPDPGPGEVAEVLGPGPEGGEGVLQLQEHGPQHAGVPALAVNKGIVRYSVLFVSRRNSVSMCVMK